MWIWSDVGPMLPWLITSVSVAYVAYIHYKLRKQLRQSGLDQCKVNPAIDKTKGKVKHVFKGEHLEKVTEESIQDSNSNKSEVKTTATDYYDEERDSEGRPRGRRSAFSYFVTECAEEEENPLCQTSGDRRIFADFAKKCAHNWKKLSEEDKQHFHTLSDEDRNRYEREIKIYRKQHHKHHSSTRSKPKNICAKKVSEEDLTEDNLLNMAFDMFATEEMPLVRDQRPSIADINEDVLTELLQRWNHSDQEFKDQYLDRIKEESMAFNMSFNRSIRDDDECSAGDERETSPEAGVGCSDGKNCGSDEELVINLRLKGEDECRESSPDVIDCTDGQNCGSTEKLVINLTLKGEDDCGEASPDVIVSTDGLNSGSIEKLVQKCDQKDSEEYDPNSDSSKV